IGMRSPGKTVGALLCVAAAVVLTSCATTSSTEHFRNYFVPPAPAPIPAQQPIEQPPVLTAFYASEIPNLTSTFPAIPRPTDADSITKKADDRFALGKRALQEGRAADARRAFDAALEILLTTPESLPSRSLIERHIEQLTESIYRYDVDQ